MSAATKPKRRKPLDITKLALVKLDRHTVKPDSGCWLWVGYTQPNGYGYVNVGGGHWPAHRLALMRTGVVVPEGMDVCHRCDVRNCVNPDHLYAGTRKQNMADCSARRRHNKPSGERHWRARLSSADIVSIRQRAALGESQVSIGRAFGVCSATISRIVRRVWRTEVA